MSILVILFLAFGLATDAFAVSIAGGASMGKPGWRSAARIGAFFGGFQAAMPIVGWLAGISLQRVFAGFDHWVAFGLLFAIGCKMVYESFLPEKQKTGNPLGTRILLVLSIATSIDALAVGISLSLLHVAILLPAVIIGAITFLLCFCGTFIGNCFGRSLGHRLELFSGLILIAIGIKILFDHTVPGAMLR